MAAWTRLSPADLTNLAIEAPDTPMHQAVLTAIDAAGLVDDEGRIDIDAIREHVEARLERLPELKRVLYRPPLFQGRPAWVDDSEFRIENHLVVATLPPPGGEIAALDFSQNEMSNLLDRTRPLWKMWFLEGYAREKIGLLIKLHHAVADGPAMVNMLGQLFDVEPRPPEREHRAWVTDERPTAGELLRDNIRLRAASLARAIARLAHPFATMRSARTSVASIGEAIRQGRGAPRMSFNRPVGVTRRVAALHLGLGELREIAHREGVKLNDVFLYLVAGALRQVLIARGEQVDGLSLRASVAVSRTRIGGPVSGNHAGTVIVSIPLDVVEPRDRLAAVAAATARAKTKQLPVVSTGMMVLLARTGITRLYIRHQHLLNVLTTNLPGPPVPLYFAGGRVHGPIAIPPIAGNVTISFAALSYAGGLTVSAVADREMWPDLQQLIQAMRRSLAALQDAQRPVTPPAELSLAG